ncbi:MAG: hypothetical protein PQJ47_06935 [Sphaerochaetaceae bacterium]|nr:hypothetical protein [Sphaerochaetaceae bacterium]
MKHINRWRAVLGTIVLAALVVFASTGCSLFLSSTMPPEGSYELVGDYGTETWDIDEDTISYDSGYTSYEADIISTVVDSFNAGDSTIVSSGSSPSGDYGYMVIQYTTVSDEGTGEVGKYNIFRWQENADDASAMDFTQGYKDADGESPYINALFDTAQDAVDGATNDNGYFSFASEGAVLQTL